VIWFERDIEVSIPMRRRIEMTFLAKFRVEHAKAMCLAVVALALLTSGCTSKSTSADEKVETGSSNRININCIGDRLENPPEAFHYSFKFTDGKDAVDKEADITPQAMDITIQDKSGSHNYHGVHSDEGSWSSALVDLSGSGFTVMTARLDFIKDNSAVKSGGAEVINGYQTTKYSIDTTAANSSDKQTFETMFSPGSYEKGNLWATADGCPVKLILDEGRKIPNGNLDNFHYDIAMIKK
jgi:hypothetical protein